ncbi:MAG: carbon-nitrogen hydrolase [Candidatus Aminicenantes bacterium]|nr:carbon-nitrogen hydrolase [Candidatus Aminicenantes bacterium]
MRAVLAQFAPGLGSVSANLDRHLETIDRARREKADLVVFPELSLTGYRLRDLVEEVALDPAASRPFRKLRSASREIDLVVGFVEEKPRERGLFYNAAAYLHRGRVLHLHRKVFLPTAGMFEERRFFSEGRNIRAFDGPHGRTGLLICRDFLHLNAHYLLFADGAEISIAISAAPGRGVSPPARGFASSRMWELMGETVSRLTTTFVLYVNRVGFEDGAAFAGGSFVFDPFGRPVARAGPFEPEFLIADLDLGLIRKARKAWPFRRDDKPEVTLAALERIVRGYED